MTLPDSYRRTHRTSIEDPAAFWAAGVDMIEWVTRPTTVLDDSGAPFYRWFPDGELNTSVNALDRHVRAGHGEQAAIVYDSPVTGRTATTTYQQLLQGPRPSLRGDRPEPGDHPLRR
jgi:propionyl-CoA synthetase